MNKTVKYCKACKAPLRADEDECRLCGTPNKESPRAGSNFGSCEVCGKRGRKIMKDRSKNDGAYNYLCYKCYLADSGYKVLKTSDVIEKFPIAGSNLTSLQIEYNTMRRESIKESSMFVIQQFYS